MTPGILPDEEEIRRFAGANVARPNTPGQMPPLTLRGLGGPPAAPPAAAPTAEPAAAPAEPVKPLGATPMPEAGSTADLEAKAHQLSPPRVASPSGRPRPEDFKPEEMKLWQKILSPLAIGAASWKNPGAASGLIDQFYQAPQREAQKKYETASAAYDKEQEDKLREANVEHLGAETGKLGAETAALGQPKPKEEKWMPVTGWTDADGTPLIHEENSGQMVRADNKQRPTGFKATKPEGFKTREITRVVNGVPHTVMVDAETGNDVKDEGQTKLPGESPEQKRNAAESAQVEREARGNIRKASDQYRATQQSVNQMNASIDAAKDGNGLLTSFVPTMEVLGINASNGVHRISPAEAQAAGLPGGWVERFNAWFDKATTGKLSPQLQAEGKELGQILAHSAYQRYKSTYDDESGIVSGYGGTNFGKRVPLIPGEGIGGPAGASGAGVTVGGFTFPDQASADAFKKEAGIQ